ncbi:MAG: hypothetical protein NT005_17215 [Spirochaetes bacterium]|nr:hypothetical protein [Spirochaetota bacterium]
MVYPFTHPGFENHQIALKPGGWWSGPVLMIDGKKAPRGRKRGEYLLTKNDGTQSIARLKTVFFLEPTPQVIIDDRVITLAEPLKWFQWVWISMPLALPVLGGAIGALVGVVAGYVNLGLFRSRLKEIVKYGLTAVVTIASVIASSGLATLFTLGVRWLDIGAAQEFKSEVAGFSIMSPVGLKETTQPIETDAGTIELRSFSGARNGTAYAVMCSVLPEKLLAQDPPATILDRALEGIASSVEGVIVAENEIAVAGNLGREVEAKGKGKDGSQYALKTLLVLVENHLYQVLVVTPQGTAFSKKMTDFIRSFTLLDTKPRAP